MEQRKYRRFSVKQGAIAVIETEKKIAAKIIDIGIGGIALKYPGNPVYITKNCILNLLIFNTVSIEMNFPLRVTSNLNFPFTPGAPPSSRIGAQFGELSAYQSTVLDRFIIHIGENVQK